MFMYFLLPHWVPATWRSRAQTSIRRNCRPGTAHHTGTAADLPVESFDNVIGTDASPVLAGKIAVGQRFLNAILHLLGRLFQFHGAQFFHHSFGLFPGCFLAFLGVDRLSIFATSFTLERGVTENTLR